MEKRLIDLERFVNFVSGSLADYRLSHEEKLKRISVAYLKLIGADINDLKGDE